MTLQPTPNKGDPRDLTLLDVNARYMTHEQFTRLVDNVRKDGALTSSPLVWLDPANGERVVLSGNHRVKAAIEAGLDTVHWLEITGDLPRQRRVAVQLSHNAIEGQDDPAVLKRLYDELEDIDWRGYSGLDDKTLELLAQVDVAPLGEANLDFSHVQLMFLPAERDKVASAFTAAVQAVRTDERWVAHLDQYEPLLETLETVHTAHNVTNVAAALMILITIMEEHVEEHVGELRDGWYNPDTLQPRHNGGAPLETLFGVRSIPSSAASVIQQALDHMLKTGDITPQAPWRALELWAADHLAGNP
ncbi:MAG: ParB N-terminal domain-containing protein [Acidimicrobiales bacterium]